MRAAMQVRAERWTMRSAAFVGALGFLAAGVTAAFGATPPAAAPLTCPDKPVTDGPTIAGYTVLAFAAGIRNQLNSPGLLPVGDARVGTIIETDVPFARSIVTGGPVINSLASPAYPGDTAANLGTALGTFGAPGIPNEPVLAQAVYPTPPGFSDSATFPGTASAHANPEFADAQAGVGSSTVGDAKAAAVAAGATTTSTGVRLQTSCVDAIATSTTAGIDIAGLVHIEGITAKAQARSDGATFTPKAELSIGKVTVAGLAAFIDRDGIHLAANQAVPVVVADQVENTLNKTLAAAGISVRLVSPTTTNAADGGVSVDSGGVGITIVRTLAAIGVAGVPSLQLPGRPPIPLGTPDVPLHIEAVYGAAHVDLAATQAPSFDDLPPDTTLPGGTIPSGPSGGSSPPSFSGGGGDTGSPPASDGFGSVAPVSQTGTPASSGGPVVITAGPVVRTSPGTPVPVAWILIGIVGAILAAGPLLGYARWQLLEGRQ